MTATPARAPRPRLTPRDRAARALTAAKKAFDDAEADYEKALRRLSEAQKAADDALRLRSAAEYDLDNAAAHPLLQDAAPAADEPAGAP